MPRVPFDQLPPNARLWIFAADRPLSSAERPTFLADIDRFLDHWAAHKVPLPAARELRYDRFLLIGVDESSTGASGCSVDALVRAMKTFEEVYGLELVNHAPVLYREGDDIRRVPREEFRELARSGRLTPDTVVFDNTLTSVGALQQGRWETRAADAWHGRAFFAARPRT